MTYQIELTPTARHALTHGLPISVAVACEEFLREVLTKDPYPVAQRLCEDLSGRYSARPGEFRVIFEIHDEPKVVRVITIRHQQGKDEVSDLEPTSAK